MLRNHKKLELAVCLLLILKNGVFADLNCIFGMKIGESNGYNGKIEPVTFLCQPDEKCVRVEADEITVEGEISQ